MVTLKKRATCVALQIFDNLPSRSFLRLTRINDYSMYRLAALRLLEHYCQPVKSITGYSATPNFATYPGADRYQKHSGSSGCP